MSIKEDNADVDFGESVLREINISLVDVKIGDYVLVHAGYAIQVIDEDDALKTISLIKQIFEADISVK